MMQSKRQQILIECDVLNDLLQQNDSHIVLIDATVQLFSPEFDGDYRVKSGYELWQKVHIPSSVHVDQYHDFSDTTVSYSFAPPDVVSAQQFLQKIGIQQHSQVIIYDSRDGIWAARLWRVLASLGITSRILNGGLKAWQALKYETEQGMHRSPQQIDNSTLTLQQKLGFWSDINVVAQASITGTPTLVCALGEAQFLGQAVSRYARRGSIPNSINIPARHFIGADNKFISDAEISKILADFDLSRNPNILYCGGGISVCVLAVAIRLVSDTHFSIYDGSLQEWAQAPERPLFIG